MEAAVEVEDDIFFADLSKRISLLIMDDDEDSLPDNCPSVNLQAIHPAIQMQTLHQQTSTTESKGTGVFIPRSSHPRRKNRQGRHARFHRHSDNSGRLPHIAYNNNNNNSYASYNSLYPRIFKL
ncbi:Hypothetical predicted protein [Olea europaea subsp. europaea]|uniref:Uncharacterized protein n=1 Tax=Olea europaea subsp. europaea TaxID=158383 RepID=A0A8S0VMI3_OLEEU|nr:Hypothetical predicted protein [Olea europaea subsp. europaea]